MCGRCAGGGFDSESEWRFNVADLGLTHLGFHLCARLVTPIGVNNYVVKYGTGTPGGYLMAYSTSGEFMFVNIFPVFGRPPKFPYGYVVDPD